MVGSNAAIFWVHLISLLIPGIVNEPEDLPSPEDKLSERNVRDDFLKKAYEAAENLESIIELSITARTLPTPDRTSRELVKFPKPVCFTYILPFNCKTWLPYQGTEIHRYNYNPDFEKKINISSILSSPEKPLHVKFEIYHYKGWLNGRKYQNQEFLGQAVCNLEELIRDGKMTLQLKSNFDYPLNSEIIVYAEKLINNYDEVVLKLIGEKFYNTRWVLTPNPFINIEKVTKSKVYVFAHKTEVFKRSLNPEWTTHIPVRNVCNGERERDLKFTIRDKSKLNNLELIGQFHTSLGELVEGKKKTFDLENPNAKKKLSSYGRIKVDTCLLNKIPSFVDFVRSGLKLRSIIAIDFSKANFDSNLQRSLHHREETETGTLNKYEEALISYTNVIKDYAMDEEFSLIGFGAEQKNLEPNATHNDEIFNLDPDSEKVKGIDAVLKTYRKFSKIEPAETVNVVPLIQQAIRASKSAAGKSDEYFIFLILLRGQISDIDKTEEIMQEAFQLPVSIIIVDMGEPVNVKFYQTSPQTKFLRNFTALERTQKNKRNILHFTTFYKARFDDLSDAKSLLERSVLVKLPKQVLSYMRLYDFMPKNYPLPPMDALGGETAPILPSHSVSDSPPTPILSIPHDDDIIENESDEVSIPTESNNSSVSTDSNHDDNELNEVHTDIGVPELPPPTRQHNEQDKLHPDIRMPELPPPISQQA